MTGDGDLAELIAAERHVLGDVLQALPEAAWDAASLCAGWRVREVVAHITMPFRYRPGRFLAEMARSRGDFSRMSDRCARRDAREPTGTLLRDLRTNERNPWRPPGGGLVGALTHDVVHSLDITVPLGIDLPVPEPALRLVLENVASPKSRKHFGVDLSGVRLEADDLDWTFGEGTPLRGHAQHLVLVLCGRHLPVEFLEGSATALFTSP